MSFAEKVTRAYFDFVYNPCYDFTTGRLPRYRKLQRTCIGKLRLKDGDNILCVGLGTGNEVPHILKLNRNVKIVGVDISKRALRKAYRKGLAWGKQIEVIVMDVRRLKFATASFDKVLCLHVMDFMEDAREATKEILRVLKNGGQFVITYPSGKEDVKLALDLLKDSIRHNINSGKHRGPAFFELLAQAIAGTVYLPLALRSNKKVYSRNELEGVIGELTTGDFEMQEEPLYRDFIVYGEK